MRNFLNNYYVIKFAYQSSHSLHAGRPAFHMHIASDVLVHPHHLHQLDVQVDCLGRCPGKEHENEEVQESRDQATQPGNGGDVSSNEEKEVETGA